MLNMCIPIPSRLPPDPIRSSETLISSSCNDSLLWTESALPTVEGVTEQSELHSHGDCADKAVEEHQESEKVLEEQESEKVLEEQESEKVLEEQQESVCGGEKVSEGKDSVGCGDEVGETGSKVEEDDREPSPPSSPLRFGFDRRYREPYVRRTHCDPYNFSSGSNFLRINSSGDLDDDSSDTALHMHASSSCQPPPPSPPPLGAGLANLGNTCFLNAVMQCFTHTVPLVLGLHSLYDYGLPLHHNEGEFCALSAVRDHVFQALGSSGGVIYPDNLVNNLSYVSSFFQRYQQEDAHEYLQSLLDKTDTCWAKCKADNKGVLSQGDNLVKRVFGGRLVSQLHCCNCGSRSDTYEPLVDLSLEIEDADDLNGALKSFTKMEENEEEVKFTCENCKEQVPLKKQLLIDEAPSVATLHLKRFKGDGYFVEKIDKALKYPLELDLKPYTTLGSEDENVELKYELYGVIVHRGLSSTSGHYLCYIRSSPDNWFRIDDSKITKVREEVALSQQGYILFYAKKGTPWPCSLVKSSSCDDNGTWKWNTSPKSVLDNDVEQHSNLQNEGNLSAANASTEIVRLPCQKSFDEVAFCSRSSDVIASSEPPCTIPNTEACIPKDNEAPEINPPMVIYDSSQKPTPPGSSTTEHEINDSKQNAAAAAAYISPSKYSPQIYSESEDHHPEAAEYPGRLNNRKVVKSPSPKKRKWGFGFNKHNKLVNSCPLPRKRKRDIYHDRKMKEAQRSVRSHPGSRRRNRQLMAALDDA